MIDYDGEARDYDASRGGEPRARAAADALERLLPQGRCSVLDIACGTGIVTRRLLRPGRTVLGADRSPAMLALADRRVPGGVVRADATRLPFASASVDVVVIVWLLHLLEESVPVLTEAARVLRPGGTLITTVDKDEAYFVPDSDVARATAEPRLRYAPQVPDHSSRVTGWAAGEGLTVAGETVFRGTGQGRSPRTWQEVIRAGRIPWAPAGEAAGVCERLAALPDQDTARPDPLYRLIAFRRHGPGTKVDSAHTHTM
ncbi:MULTISPECIES: class I SAM-dependent methyltransferase [unclassified Streptomyces]|uniref:class I SAM-dependent methyltransferase n=1 Tax=unclassified Streptomyces TaxID=2593676 RepID=UPI00190B3FC0|nr:MULTISPECIES: class I SAM-dependent methyltransferase [unclassified Streptomyces]MBK3568486.1 class I SAM-dependent methyltransferase [Streptomyces sp. MBT62]MBK6015430.1 class I SAM-dependent methyltransferase [Streptomyces sp. MBT53]